MHFYPSERLAIFIDGANLYATAKALGFDIDYKRLLALFRSKSQLVRALYYTALAEDQEYSSIRPLVDWLDYNGFTMVTKPTKEFTDAVGRRKTKGNMDIELSGGLASNGQRKSPRRCFFTEPAATERDRRRPRARPPRGSASRKARGDDSRSVLLLPA
jgi:NYN domain